MPEGHEPPTAHSASELSDDEKHLAKLGYAQDLNRSWSGFSNFAISFSIISILAGCFTNYQAGFNNGGPISISWSWLILGIFILIIGFTMSELVSAYPTSGGIYWWASKLGGPKAGFFTGWLNLIGLVAVTAGVSYGCATFIDLTLNTLSESWADDYSLTRVFIIFVIVLAIASVLNIFSGHLMAIVNNISVWWHVAGASLIVAILVFVPDSHQGPGYVFTDTFNNSGWFDGDTKAAGFFLIIVPFGFLLTQYTITGFDASAHLSEETASASKAAAQGIWRSILYSVIGGYILLLAVTFAIPDDASGNPDNAGVGAGGVAFIFNSALGQNWAGLVLFISAAAQLFCSVACMTSASRMTFAFARDNGIPGSGVLSRLNGARVPANAVLFVAVCAAVLTLPALKSIEGLPIAFFAVTSIAVMGLYLAFAIPIYLRWRMGDAFEAGSWTNGSKYKWMNPIAVLEIVVVSLFLMLPTTPAGAPWRDEFTWSSVNYSGIVTIGALILLAIWWSVSAKNWFTGPKHTIDKAVVEAFDD
jgi:amino acid transporter